MKKERKNSKIKNENEKGSRNELWIKNEFENESCFSKPSMLKSF